VTATDASGNSSTAGYEVDGDAASETFSHDANGNLSSDGTRTFEWDAQNQLVAVNVGTHRSEYTYDRLQRRGRIVKKEKGRPSETPVCCGRGTAITEERLTTGEVNRFFADGGQHNGLARCLTRDHLGSIREVTGASGTVVTRNDYDPYGRSTRVAGTEGTRFGYTGHLNHTSSGLVLALYRAYDPALGRWLSEDPAGRDRGPGASGGHFDGRVEIKRARAPARRDGPMARARDGQAVVAQAADVERHGLLDAAQGAVERLAGRDAPRQVGDRRAPITVRIPTDAHEVLNPLHGLGPFQPACRLTDANVPFGISSPRWPLIVTRPGRRGCLNCR
jgi:RHS repeat-associated protein